MGIKPGGIDIGSHITDKSLENVANDVVKRVDSVLSSLEKLDDAMGKSRNLDIGINKKGFQNAEKIVYKELDQIFGKEYKIKTGLELEKLTPGYKKQLDSLMDKLSGKGISNEGLKDVKKTYTEILKTMHAIEAAEKNMKDLTGAFSPIETYDENAIKSQLKLTEKYLNSKKKLRDLNEKLAGTPAYLEEGTYTNFDRISKGGERIVKKYKEKAKDIAKMTTGLPQMIEEFAAAGKSEIPEDQIANILSSIGLDKSEQKRVKTDFKNTTDIINRYAVDMSKALRNITTLMKKHDRGDIGETGVKDLIGYYTSYIAQGGSFKGYSSEWIQDVNDAVKGLMVDDETKGIEKTLKDYYANLPKKDGIDGLIQKNKNDRINASNATKQNTDELSSNTSAQKKNAAAIEDNAAATKKDADAKKEQADAIEKSTKASQKAVTNVASNVQLRSLEEVNAELKQVDDEYAKISKRMDDYNDRYFAWEEKRAKYEKQFSGKTTYDYKKIANAMNLQNFIVNALDFKNTDKINKNAFKGVYDQFNQLLEVVFSEHGLGAYLSKYGTPDDFMNDYDSYFIRDMMSGVDSAGEKVTYSPKTMRARLAKVFTYIKGLAASIDLSAVKEMNYISAERDTEKLALNAEKAANQAAYQENRARKEALSAEYAAIVEHEANAVKEETKLIRDNTAAVEENKKKKKSTSTTSLDVKDNTGLSLTDKKSVVKDLIDYETKSKRFDELEEKEQFEELDSKEETEYFRLQDVLMNTGEAVENFRYNYKGLKLEMKDGSVITATADSLEQLANIKVGNIKNIALEYTDLKIAVDNLDKAIENFDGSKLALAGLYASTGEWGPMLDELLSLTAKELQDIYGVKEDVANKLVDNVSHLNQHLFDDTGMSKDLAVIGVLNEVAQVAQICYKNAANSVIAGFEQMEKACIASGTNVADYFETSFNSDAQKVLFLPVNLEAIPEVKENISLEKESSKVQQLNNKSLEERIALLKDMKKAASMWNTYSHREDGGEWLDVVQSPIKVNGTLYDSLEDCYALYKVIVNYADGTKGVFDQVWNPDVNPGYDMFEANEQFRKQIDLRKKILDVRFEEFAAEINRKYNVRSSPAISSASFKQIAADAKDVVDVVEQQAVTQEQIVNKTEQQISLEQKLKDSVDATTKAILEGKKASNVDEIKSMLDLLVQIGSKAQTFTTSLEDFKYSPDQFMDSSLKTLSDLSKNPMIDRKSIFEFPTIEDYTNFITGIQKTFKEYKQIEKAVRNNAGYYKGEQHTERDLETYKEDIGSAITRYFYERDLIDNIFENPELVAQNIQKITNKLPKAFAAWVSEIVDNVIFTLKNESAYREEEKLLERKNAEIKKYYSEQVKNIVSLGKGINERKKRYYEYEEVTDASDDIRNILGWDLEYLSRWVDGDNNADFIKTDALAGKIADALGVTAKTTSTSVATLPLVQESSGQLAFLENVKEASFAIEDSQNAAQAEIKETNEVLEGQINLFDYLNNKNKDKSVKAPVLDDAKKEVYDLAEAQGKLAESTKNATSSLEEQQRTAGKKQISGTSGRPTKDIDSYTPISDEIQSLIDAKVDEIKSTVALDGLAKYAITTKNDEVIGARITYKDKDTKNMITDVYTLKKAQEDANGAMLDGEEQYEGLIKDRSILVSDEIQLAEQNAREQKKLQQAIDRSTGFIIEQQSRLNKVVSSLSSVASGKVLLGDKSPLDKGELEEIDRLITSINDKISTLNGKALTSAEKSGLKSQISALELRKVELQNKYYGATSLTATELTDSKRILTANYDIAIAKAKELGAAADDTADALKQQKDAIANIKTSGEIKAATDDLKACKAELQAIKQQKKVEIQIELKQKKLQQDIKNLRQEIDDLLLLTSSNELGAKNYGTLVGIKRQLSDNSINQTEFDRLSSVYKGVIESKSLNDDINYLQSNMLNWFNQMSEKGLMTDSLTDAFNEIYNLVDKIASKNGLDGITDAFNKFKDSFKHLGIQDQFDQIISKGKQVRNAMLEVGNAYAKVYENPGAGDAVANLEQQQIAAKQLFNEYEKLNGYDFVNKNEKFLTDESINEFKRINEDIYKNPPNDNIIERMKASLRDYYDLQNDIMGSLSKKNKDGSYIGLTVDQIDSLDKARKKYSDLRTEVVNTYNDGETLARNITRGINLEDDSTFGFSKSLDKVYTTYQSIMDGFTYKFKNTSVWDKVKDSVSGLSKELSSLKAEASEAATSAFAAGEAFDFTKYGNKLVSFGDKASLEMSKITDFAKEYSAVENKLNAMSSPSKMIGKSSHWTSMINSIRSGLSEISYETPDAKEKLSSFMKVLDFYNSKSSQLAHKTKDGVLFGSFGSKQSIEDTKTALNDYAATLGYTEIKTEEFAENGDKISRVYQGQNKELHNITATMTEYGNRFNDVKHGYSTMLGDWGQALGGMVQSFSRFFGGYHLFTRFTREAREGLNVLKQYDAAITDISYSMDINSAGLKNLGDSAVEMAKDLSTSLENTLGIYQIYANMNTSAQEIQETAKPTAILANLSGKDALEASDQIQGVLQQFNMLKDAEVDVAATSMHVVDVLDSIASNVSLDYVKGMKVITDSVTAAGAVAYDAGMSYEQLAAVSAKVAERSREDGSTIGNAIKTIVTRISKVGKMPAYADEVSNEEISKAAESLNEIGVAVYNADGSFRDLDVILTELQAKWDGLSDAQQANLSYNIAA